MKAAPIKVHVTTKPDEPTRLLIHAARVITDEKARRMHPNDLYAQTVMVMGYDPLARP